MLCEIGKRFAFIEANSVEQINLCKELRHKIYCEEFKWEPETTSGLEINSHDELAKYYLMFDPTFRIKFRNKSLGIMCQVHQ